MIIILCGSKEMVSEFSKRVIRAERLVGRKLKRARKWHRLAKRNERWRKRVLKDDGEFTRVYTWLFRELRPDQGKPNMASVMELIAEGLFKDRHDAIVAMYPAYEKKVL